MNIGNIGWSGLILILVALLLVFGPSKLPEIGKAFGKSLREFRSATKGMMEEASEAAKQPEPATEGAPAAAATIEPIELKEESQ